MIKGFSQLVHQGSDAHLFVVGTGSLLNELEALAKKLRIDQRVRFLGKTNRALSFLSKLDVFVLTSRYEGFGLVLLEAMSLNVPIIASNASAIPEVLGVNHPGLFKLGDEFDLAQKLYSTQDEGFRESIINFQKHRLEKFSSGAMSKATISLYGVTIRDNI
jgi:glycosyltransferase involved in cell wall biosynthesis